MFRLALVFLIVALIAALFGLRFTESDPLFAAKALFFACLVFVTFLVAGDTSPSEDV